MTSGNDPSDIFRQEAQDLLEQLEQALLDLANQPQDRELIDSAFRALHTIKGSGAMFGFDHVAAFTHHLETTFELLRQDRIAAGADLLSVALRAKDHIRQLLNGVADDAAGAAILADLDKVVNGAAATDTATPRQRRFQIHMRLPRQALLMGTNPLLLLDELRALGTAEIRACTGDIPALEDFDPTECRLAWEVTLATDRPRTAIEDVFLFVIDDMELRIDEIDDEADPLPDDISDAPPASEPEPAQARPSEGAARNAGSIRVPAERLDELMDRVGELVIAQSRLKQIAAGSSDPHLLGISEEIERLALELRDTTMGVRMVPIASLFGRFRRLLHDLSGELGKAIALTTSGEETELDKTVIERLADPLVHLLRNAVDHGLETPEERRAAGKPVEGRIQLSARHAGDKVRITIADDGRGLDRDRILARAEERGLVAPGAKLADAEIFQFIFQPGFSTAAQVTNISGRGVGMDVVKRTIDTLRGTIEVASQPGQGTRITLCLPLTLAIIEGLLVRVGNGRYVIPLSAVEECVEFTAAEDAETRGRSFLNIRGALVPFLRLREKFAIAGQPDPYQKIVIVSAGEARVGLAVDQVIGDHQTVIKSLSKLHADVSTFSGATILGDGSVALILEVGSLVADGRSEAEQMPQAAL